MTDDDKAKRLAEIRSRAEAATKGPWRFSVAWVSGVPVTELHVAEQTVRLVDAHFIASARDDIQWMLAEVDRLRAIEAAAIEVDRVGYGYDRTEEQYEAELALSRLLP